MTIQSLNGRFTQVSEQKKDETTAEGLRRKAYGMAQSALRKAHTEEFELLREAACKALDVEYTRRMTPREKAEVQMAALKAQYPDLA